MACEPTAHATVRLDGLCDGAPSDSPCAYDDAISFLVESLDIQIIVNEGLGYTPDDEVDLALSKLTEFRRRVLGIAAWTIICGCRRDSISMIAGKNPAIKDSAHPILT